MAGIITSYLPFILSAGVVILLGIIAFNFLRPNSKSNNNQSHAPNFYARPINMIGRRGAALRDGPEGMSRIQVDGVEWPVCCNDNASIRQGEILEVTAFDGTTLLAKKLAA